MSKMMKIELIIFLTCILSLASSPVAFGSPLNITIATNKQIYSPGDRIPIKGNLTLGNNTVSDGVVAIQVDDPKGNPLILRARPTGINITKSWSVEILSVVPVGSAFGEPSYSFTRGSYAGFNVTFRNNDLSSHTAMITINTYYSNDVPFSAQIMYNGTIEGERTMSVFSYPLVTIPGDAPLGNATVYASVLVPPLPKNLGFALSPEKKATFTIISGTLSLSMGDSQMPTSSLESTEGTYNLTFKTPTFNAKLGNYTIYATSFYRVGPYPYFAINSLTFKVKLIGDVTGPKGVPDGKVDIRDLTKIAKAYGSFPGYPNWDPVADLNGDLKVDIKDITLAAVNYGKTGSY